MPIGPGQSQLGCRQTEKRLSCACLRSAPRSQFLQCCHHVRTLPISPFLLRPSGSHSMAWHHPPPFHLPSHHRSGAIGGSFIRWRNDSTAGGWTFAVRRRTVRGVRSAAGVLWPRPPTVVQTAIRTSTRRPTRRCTLAAAPHRCQTAIRTSTGRSVRRCTLAACY